MKFTDEDVATMSLGATVLGGGGGGDPYLAEVMLHEIIRRRGPVEMVSVDELDSDDDIVPLALIGSPHAIAEKLVDQSGIRTLFSDNALRGRSPAAVMAYELAGLNALYPLAAAAQLGVPFVDADFVGRGFPGLDTTLLEADDAGPGAYVLCDPLGRTVIIEKTGALSMERLVRPIVETMGWLAALSTSSLTTEFCRRHALLGSASRCLQLGRTFAGFASQGVQLVEEALAGVGGRLLGSGRIVERVSSPDAFGPRASLAIEPDEANGPVLRVELRNEFHVAAREGVVLASVPDIIVVADRNTWEPLSTESVARDRDVHVIALPVDSRWRAAGALALAGPRAFGYGIDYVDFATVGGQREPTS